jgi:hypothetical protein
MATLGQTIAGAAGGVRGGGSDTALIIQALAALGRTSKNIGDIFQQMEASRFRASESERADIRLAEFLKQSGRTAEIQAIQKELEAGRLESQKKREADVKAVEGHLDGKTPFKDLTVSQRIILGEMGPRVPEDPKAAIPKITAQMRSLATRSKDPSVDPAERKAAQEKLGALMVESPVTLQKRMDTILAEVDGDPAKAMERFVEEFGPQFATAEGRDFWAGMVSDATFAISEALGQSEIPDVQFMDDDALEELVFKRGAEEPGLLFHASVMKAVRDKPEYRDKFFEIVQGGMQGTEDQPSRLAGLTRGADTPESLGAEILLSLLDESQQAEVLRARKVPFGIGEILRERSPGGRMALDNALGESLPARYRLIGGDLEGSREDVVEGFRAFTPQQEREYFKGRFIEALLRGSQ